VTGALPVTSAPASYVYTVVRFPTDDDPGEIPRASIRSRAARSR
jgi:hypothetical protein